MTNRSPVTLLLVTLKKGWTHRSFTYTLFTLFFTEKRRIFSFPPSTEGGEDFRRKAFTLPGVRIESKLQQ